MWRERALKRLRDGGEQPYKSLLGARWHMQAVHGIWPQISSLIQAQCVVAIACVGRVCLLAWHLRCDLSTFAFAFVL
jgi:hypothetical protein